MTQEEINEIKNILYTEKMNLQTSLENDDYKIIKCAEAQAIGVTMPYDVVSLHSKRQGYRDRINAIEEEIEELDDTEPDNMGPEDNIIV